MKSTVFRPVWFSGNGGYVIQQIRFFGKFRAFAFLKRTDYDTRIYSYEPDLLYSFSLPAFYGRGITLLYKPARGFQPLDPHG